METNIILKKFRELYPEYNDWSDESIWKNLKQPEKFKKAFPIYKDWDNNVILKNLAKYDKSILYIKPKIDSLQKIKPNTNYKSSEVYKDLKQTNPALTTNISKILKNKLVPEPDIKISKTENVNILQKNINDKLKNQPKVKYTVRATPKPEITEQTDLSDIYRKWEKNIWPKMNWADKKKKNEYFYAYLKGEANYNNKTIKAINKNLQTAKRILPGISKKHNYKLNAILKDLKTNHPEQYQIIANAFQDYYKDKIPKIVRLSEMAGRGALKGATFGFIDDKAINSVLGKIYGKENTKLIHNISKNTSGAELTEFVGDFIGSIVSGKALAKGFSTLAKLDKIKNAAQYAKRMALVRGATSGAMTGIRNFNEYLKGNMSLKDVLKNTASSTAGALIGLIPENYITNKTIIGKIGNLVGQVGTDVGFNIISDILTRNGEEIGNAEWWKQQGFNAIPSAVFAIADLLHPGELRIQQSMFKKGLKEQTKFLKSKISKIKNYWGKQNRIKPNEIKTRSLTHADAGTPSHPGSAAAPSTGQDINNILQYKQDVKKNIENLYIPDEDIINKKFSDIKKELQPVLENQLLGMAGELKDWKNTPEAGTRWADTDEYGNRIAGGLKSLKPDWAGSGWGRKYVDRYLQHIDNILAGKEDINNPIVKRLKQAALERAKEGFIDKGQRSDAVSDETFGLLKERRNTENRLDTSEIDKRLDEIRAEMDEMDKIPGAQWDDKMRTRLNELIKEGEQLTNEKEKKIKNFKKNSKNVEKILYNNNIEEKGIDVKSQVSEQKLIPKAVFDNKKIADMSDDEVNTLLNEYDFLSDKDKQKRNILLSSGKFNNKDILEDWEERFKPSGISSKTHNVFNHVAKNKILSNDIKTGNKKKIFVYGDLNNFTTMNGLFGHTGTDMFKEKIYRDLANIVKKYDPNGKFGQDTNGDEHWAIVNIDKDKASQMIKEMQDYTDNLANKKYRINRDELKKFIKNQHGEYKEKLQEIYDSGVTEITLKDLPYKTGGTKSFNTKEGFVEYDPAQIRNSGEDIESAIKRITKEADEKIADKKTEKGGDKNGTREIQKMGSEERRRTAAESDVGTRRLYDKVKKQQKSSAVSSSGEYPGNQGKNQISARASGKSNSLNELNKLINDPKTEPWLKKIYEKELKLGIVSPETRLAFEIDEAIKDASAELKEDIKKYLNLENIKKATGDIKIKWQKIWERYYGLKKPLKRAFVSYEEGVVGLKRRLKKIILNHFGKYSKDLREYASLYLENPKKYPAENSKNPEAVKEIAEKVRKFQDWALKKLKEVGVFDESFQSYFHSKINALKKEKERLSKELLKAKNNNKLYDKISKEIDDIDAEITKLRNYNYLHHYVKNPKLKKKIFIWLKTGLIKKLRINPKELKGRKFNTIDDLKDAGFEVETDAAVITARVLRLTLESIRNKELIDTLKQSKDFVLKKEEAVNNPNTIDWVKIPEVEGLNGYVVHPFIADAIKELVWSPKYDTPWKKMISKPLRKLNIMLKLARFYKPFIMLYNDLQQAWMALPFKSIITFPKNFIGAVKDVNQKSNFYEEIEKYGGYNKDYTFYKKLFEDTVGDILDKKNKGITYVRLRKLIKDINPVNLIKDIYKTTNDITWNLDEIIRTAVVKELMSNGMKLPEAVDRMNKFMGHYNYLPKSTKHALNTWAFVGNYRLSMLRLYKSILQDAGKGIFGAGKSLFSGDIKKAEGKFKKGIWASRAAVKWLIWKLAISKYLYMLGYAGALMGYRYMKKDKDKIKVISMGGPVYDPSKIASRPLQTTLLYNMAALPGLTGALLYNKGWHGKRIYNPFATKKEQFRQIASYTLESFFPWTTEIKNLSDKSKTLISKILNSLGIAYTYEIKKMTVQQLAQMIKEVKMRGDLSRAEKIKKIRSLRAKYHRDRIKFHKKSLEIKEVKK